MRRHFGAAKCLNLTKTDDTKEEIDNVEKICERESKVSIAPPN